LEARGASFQDLALERLRFFIDGPPEVAFRLYELLCSQASRVAFIANPEGPPSTPYFRPGGSLRPLGFGPEEEVLPAPPLHHRALRLLREYFAFPEKFLFFELEPGRECLQAATDALEVLVLLRQLGPEDENLPVSPETFRLGCTPIINLFPKVTEPLRLDQRHTEYRLVPDHRREQETELHSILSVTASQDDTARTRRVEPIFSWRHGEGGEEPRAFWHARRQPTGRGEGPGTEVLLSFVDLDFNPELPADQTLYAHTLCTNGSLPLGLEPGMELQVEERLHVKRVSCLRRPTPPRYPPLGGSSLWRLVSTLSLHHLSLAQGEQALEALKGLLRLHGPSPGDASEQQLRGMMELSCRRVVRHSASEGWRGFYRGLELTLTFDEARYVGGSALLLGSVLSHFFGLYASVDSITQLVAKSKQREGVWKTWPPMAGDQPIL
jgi:type VI secretion system protein ImpG